MVLIVLMSILVMMVVMMMLEVARLVTMMPAGYDGDGVDNGDDDHQLNEGKALAVHHGSSPMCMD